MQTPPSDTAPTRIDALVIGAGPTGLFQVFQLGLLEIGAHVVDSLPMPGGQCTDLYADKPIYDIPGLPVCTGQQLTDRLLQQIAPFKPQFHFDQEVARVQKQDDGRFFVETTRGLRWLARVVVIAGGVGAFQPRQLKLPGLERFVGSQLFYRVEEPAHFTGQHLVIVGGGDDALRWALHCVEHDTQRAASVTLVHRRDDFRAAPERIAQMHALVEAGRLNLVLGQPIGFDENAGRLTALRVAGGDDLEHTLPLDKLLVFYGLSPRLGPIADWGLGIERRQVQVDTAKFETSVPGIFAVGDINTYPGKRKLIVCGFHEATLAAWGAQPYVQPDRPAQLQYTTTSPRLHQLLGVSPTIDSAD